MPPIGTTNQLANLAKPLGQPTAGAPSNVLGGAAVMAARNNSGGGGGGPANNGIIPAPDYSGLLAAINAQTRALQAQLASQYVPYFNTYANYQQAGSNAANVVNPLYTAKLNDYLAQEATNRARKQADTATAQQQIQQGLTDTLAQTGIQRTRTGEDVTTNLSDIANKEQNYQQDQGTAFDNARLALLKGTQDTGSGLGQQAIGTQQANRNIEEGRQVQSFDTQKQAQELFKTRTFEDLGRSDVISQRKAGEQTTATKLDLDRYIEDLATQEKQTRNQLEQERLNALYEEQARQEQLGLQRFYSTLRGNALVNARKAYG